MTDDIASLFAFDRWANDHMLAACRQLAPEHYAAEPVPGWSSVRATVAHIAAVSDGWLRGASGEFVDAFPTEADLPTVDDAARLLDQAYARFEILWASLTPATLVQPFEFRSKWKCLTMPRWVVSRHVVNHTTYHRGQVASKLKRFGVAMAETDLIFWALEQSSRS